MTPLSMILLAGLLPQTATSSRVAAHADLAAVTADAGATGASANLSLFARGHECCMAHQYDDSSCPCSILVEDKDLRAEICDKVHRPQRLETSPHCGKSQNKGNLEIMRCNLQQEKCILCSQSELRDACRRKKSCSYLRWNQDQSKVVCQHLRERRIRDGIILTPRYASRLLRESDPWVECTEDELIDMCGVQPPCPTISGVVGKLETVCDALVRKLSTLDDIAAGLKLKGQECSAEDISAICMVQAPPPPSPCPAFESQYQLARNVCLQIKNGNRAFTKEHPATYAAASELLGKEKHIQCSAAHVEQICLNVILPRLEREQKKLRGD